MKVHLFFVTFMLLTIGQLFASGYQVLLQGNRQTGIGNNGVSLSPDSYSIFFNPGSLGMMSYNQVTVGSNLIFSHNVYWNSEQTNSTYKASTDNPVGTPFHFYGVWGASPSLKFGLGVYTPYGSGVDWGSNWKGEHILQSISLRAIYLQPTASYKLNEFISIGGGFVYAIGNVNLTRGLPLYGDNIDPSVELDGSASGIGYNVGLFIKAGNKINIGANYRSKVEMEVTDGDATFNVPSSLSGLFPDNKFNATLPLPSVASLGVTYKPNEKYSISTEVNYVGWNAYDSLQFDFKNNTPQIEDSSSPRKYENSWIFKIGAEYFILPQLAVRAGAYYDQTPVQPGYMTPETPDANRLGLTGGLGFRINPNFNIDLSFLFIRGEERTQTLNDALEAGTVNPDTGEQDVLPGTYQINAFIPGLSVSYNF